MRQGILAAVLVLSLAVFTGFSNPGAASAMPHHGHHGMMMHGGPIAFYLMNQDRLGLTQDQVQKLSKLKMDFMKTFIMEKAQIKVLHMETMALMMKHTVDTKKAMENMDNVLKHKKKIMHAFLSMIARAHRVLTDEQFQKSKKLWRQMMMMHHGMMMPHPHHPGM